MKRRLLRVEGAWWMMRMNIWMPIMVPGGWLAARHPASDWKLLAAAVATALAGGLAVVINDILDRKKDAVTAPELPLPSGVVTLPLALLTAATLAVCIVGFWRIASVSWVAWAYVLGVAALGGALVVAYSFAKPYGIVAPAVAGCAYATIPACAWLATGGGRGAYPVILALLYAMLIGAGGTIHAALRDVETDAEVGNWTVAVRLGPERTLRLGSILYGSATMCVLVVALTGGHPDSRVPLVALAALGIVSAHTYAARLQLRSGTLGRAGRAKAMRPATLSRLGSHLALIAEGSVPIAAVVGCASAVLLVAQIFGYRRRIFQGGLRHSLERAVARDRQ
ncbi:MAG TPA: UbiA family prenyltransferase [Solirubrobacteraceae bacterium]